MPSVPLPRPIAAFCLSLALATASPVEVVAGDIDPRPLDKRDTEIVYLVNSKHTVSCCPPRAETHISQIFVSLTFRRENKGCQRTLTDAVLPVLPGQRPV